VVLAALRDPTLDAAFGVRPATFRHDFGARADLAVDALAALTPALPMAWIYAHLAQSSPLEGRGAEPVVDCTRTSEYLRELPTADVSIRVYNLERTAEYADLVNTVEPLVRDFVGDREGGLAALNLGMFAASPHAVTPAHPDRHHNLLLQLEGRKEIWLEDDAASRDHHVRVLDYLRCPPAGVDALPGASSLVLEPGDGVYIPPYTFHWTQLFDEPATALSIGFATAATLQDNDAHEFDMRLRRLHVRPRPARPESVRGRTKAQLGEWALQRSARKVERSVSVAPSSGGQS
jgi:hypothetical protein